MKDMNFDWLLDVWAELKAKRLAPVAIGLVVAVVAMPALLLKGEETPADAPLPIATPASSNAAEVEVSEELAERGSKLGAYKSRDPFDGLVKPKGDDAGGDGTAIAPSDALGAAPKDGSGGGSAGAGGAGDTGSLGGGGGLDIPSDPGAGSPDAPKIVKKPSARFNYQLDLKFGRPGREKRYRSLPRMSFLPSPKLPALLFMGVPVEAESAVFFVHPGLNHQGEGECMPSRARCNFLELGVGKEHYVSANDQEFHIRLLGVKRVKLSAEKKQRAAASRTSQTRRSARTGGDGADEPGAATDQYDWPWLVDGIG